MPHRYQIYIFCVLAFAMLVSPKEAEAHVYLQAWNPAQVSISRDTVGLELETQMLDTKADPLLGLYPNPTFGPVTLYVKEDRWQGGTASIYNIIGQLIMEKPIDNSEIAFDLTNQKQGIYLVTIRNGSIHKTLRLERRM